MISNLGLVPGRRNIPRLECPKLEITVVVIRVDLDVVMLIF